MSGLTPVHGPGGPSEPLGKKEKTPREADKFKEMMKVDKISEVDEEQKKKQKRREEQEEEELQPDKNIPQTPQAPLAPFELEKEKKLPPPGMEPSSGIQISPLSSTPTTGAKVGIDKTAGRAFGAPPPETPEGGAPFPEEGFEEGYLPQQAAPPSSPQFPQYPEEEPEWPPTEEPYEEEYLRPSYPSQAKPTPPTAKEKEREKEVKRPSEIPPKVPIKEALPKKVEKKPPPLEKISPEIPKKPPSEKRPPEVRGKEPLPKPKEPYAPLKKPGAAPSPLPTAPQKTAEEKVKTIPSPREQVPAKESTEAFFEQYTRKAPPVPPKKTEEELVEEAEEMIIAPPPVEKGIPVSGKEKEKEEVSAIPPEMPAAEAPLVPTPETIVPPSPIPSYAYLHPQVLDLFERMVGVMTVMSASGVTETTITLTSPQFATSVFFGSQIIIQEFSTAPKAFNIQLVGTPQAVTLFQQNADDLMAAFSSGSYNFKVNRLETSFLSAERPLFKRKEGVSKEKGQDQGENPR